MLKTRSTSPIEKWHDRNPPRAHDLQRACLRRGALLTLDRQGRFDCVPRERPLSAHLDSVAKRPGQGRLLTRQPTLGSEDGDYSPCPHSIHSAAVVAATPSRVQSCRSFRPIVARGVTTADIGCLFDHLVGERKQAVGHLRRSTLAAFKLTAGTVRDLAFYDRLFGECGCSVWSDAGPGSPDCDGRGKLFSECPPVGTASAVISAADSRPSPGVPRSSYSRT